MRPPILILPLLLALGPPPTDDPVVRPEARVQTVPVPHGGDAADDPAIWVHPADGAKSLILGTDKQGGLHSYNLDGSQHQLVSPDCRPNNVDVLYGLPLPDGKRIDVAIASTRGSSQRGVKVWRIDPQTRLLEDLTPRVLRVMDGNAPYGLCAYHSRRDGKCYFFVTGHADSVLQYELKAQAGQPIQFSATHVRTLFVKTTAEGCVADEETGAVYIAEEVRGIWKFPAEPDGGVTGRLVARVGENGLTGDVEGLALYCLDGGKGYLVASSQGSNDFKVYRREGDNEFVQTIDPAAGKIGDVSDTDGIEITSRPLGPAFPKGLMVVQDGHNAPDHQNFKIYAWEDIMGTAKSP